MYYSGCVLFWLCISNFMLAFFVGQLDIFRILVYSESSLDGRHLYWHDSMMRSFWHWSVPQAFRLVLCPGIKHWYKKYSRVAERFLPVPKPIVLPTIVASHRLTVCYNRSHVHYQAPVKRMRRRTVAIANRQEGDRWNYQRSSWRRQFVEATGVRERSE